MIRCIEIRFTYCDGKLLAGMRNLHRPHLFLNAKQCNLMNLLKAIWMQDAE
jgi:hypothetical protein